MQTEKDMTTRIIIAGSRDFDNYELLYETMKNVVSLHFNNNIEIISGHARGADRLGERYAAEQGFPCTVFPAEWKKYGVKAGFIRNSQMLAYAMKAYPLVVAFWDGKSHGTKDTIEKCYHLGIEYRVTYYSNEPLKIWLDDVRPAPENYILCHSVNEAKRQVFFAEQSGAKIDIIDCDHDLGDFADDGGDGIKLIDWLVERQTFYPIALHTMNPVGRENMKREIERYWKCEIVYNDDNKGDL